VAEKDWAEFAQWGRFDPRLAEMWIAALSKYWKTLNPIQLMTENLKTNTPAVMGLLLDQCEGFKISKAERSVFRAWKNLVLTGVEIASGKLFLIGIHPFASPLSEFQFASKLYTRWGFGGKDIFVNKFLSVQKNVQKSILEPEKRLLLLKHLIQSKKRFSVNDYILACENRISRRVAQKDLASHQSLKSSGDTRARFYFVLRR